MKFANLLVAVAALSIAATVSAQSSPKAFVGKAAPKFSLKTLDGKTISNANTKGKVVLLDFWATWCTSCIKAGPTMQSLHTKYGGNGLMVVGVNAMETKPRPAASANYKQKHGYTFSFVSDGDKAHKAFKAVGLPIIAVIDKTGKVRAVFDDFDPAKTPAQIEAAIKSLL